MGYDPMSLEHARQKAMYSARKSGEIGGAISGGPKDLPPGMKRSPLEVAFDLEAEAARNAERAGNLADRLVGSLPSPCGQEKNPADPSALLPRLEACNTRLRLSLAAIGDALGRIERELP